MSTINLETELLRENENAFASETATLNEQAKLDAEVEKVLATAEATYLDGIMTELGFNYKLEEAQRIRREREAFASLPQNRIMSTEAIRKTCIKYGLRFLPTRYYKGALDSGIGPKLEEFRTRMGGKLPVVDAYELLGGYAHSSGHEVKTQMYIAAPADSFALQPMPRDPLLFCRLALNKFYLLHKWGDDLKTADLRKNETTSSNWNSIFSNAQAAGDLSSQLFSLGAQSAMLAANSGNAIWSTLTSPTITTSGLGQWVGAASTSS